MLPLKDLIALVVKYGPVAVAFGVLLYWMLTTLTGRMDALTAEQQVTNTRLMAICMNVAADPGKAMACLATSTSK